MKNKPLVGNALLVILIVLENLFLYYFFKRGILTTGVNAIGLFCTSALFGAVLLYKFYNTSVYIDAEPADASAKKQRVFTGVLMAAGIALFAAGYGVMFPKVAIDFHHSDVIPIIQVACRRLLSGQYAYAVVSEFGWDENLAYLPMHWMPFCIAQVMKIDPRWISFSAWCVAAIILWRRNLKIPDARMRLDVTIVLLASHFVLQVGDMGIAVYSVELLIAGYYMAFIASLNSDKFWFQAITISLCLLSRYSLLLWLPLYAVVMFVSGNRRQLYLVTGCAVASVLLVYVLPFLSKDPMAFYKGYLYYSKAALHEWTYLNYENIPGSLFSGTGYAYYIYSRFTNLDIEHRIKLMQRIHLICSIGVTVVMAIWYWFNRRKIDHRLFLMGSFKIYLTVFLFLIQVPYGYLMCVGNFVSIAIFIEQARYRMKSRS